MGELDLVFAIDCTSSMDPYITEARDNVIGIINALVSLGCDLHMALVEYRDHPLCEPTFVTQTHDFTTIPGEMKNWLQMATAAGGGDVPEAVADALQAVLYLSWREKATKVCVFITDAPPHGLGTYGDKLPDGCPDGLDPMEICRQLATKGVSVYIAGCEPSICAYKDFYLSVAHMTGGQYVPLDHAKSLVNVIIYGATEEMSLTNLANETEALIEKRIEDGEPINEMELSMFLQTKWQQQGVTTQQLQKGKKELKTAMASKAAMKMTRMDFSDVQTHYKTAKPKHKWKVGETPESKQRAEIDAKLAALSQLPTKTNLATGGRTTLSVGGLAEALREAEADTQAIDAGPSDFRCIQGGVTLTQTSRIVQKSVIKMSRLRASIAKP
ncbi:uncharacterized protein LOC128227148 [Mya arenaria]|uniref:uncharacterized protein LOC128227043 n=1 Tax=Mya arenaria TaxID=6604 RepID=UPI0022E3C864|nr:uncharacterized protein LOC128227043 [Mya arenaria]XP_052793355.1 uncharacterized protein LOC128227148 [Mya arenaria]